MALNPSILTDRDRAMIETLATKVRVLTLDQIARTWFSTAGDSRRAAERRVARLEDEGFIERFAPRSVGVRLLSRLMALAAAGSQGGARSPIRNFCIFSGLRDNHRFPLPLS